MDNKTTQFKKYSFSALTEQGALALKSEFVSNDPEYGKKVLSSIEDGLKKCDCFYISVAFITSSGIEPLLPVLKDLENRAETAPKIGLVAHFNLGLLAHINFGLSARFNFGLIA